MTTPTLGAWCHAHLRPRDVFLWTAILLMLTLGALIWMTRREGEEVSTMLSLIFGGVSTLGGYYHGQKEADEAHARLRIAETHLLEMQAELGRVREELSRAQGMLAAASPVLDEKEKERRE